MIKFQKRYFSIAINISLQYHPRPTFAILYQNYLIYWFSAVPNGITVFSLASSLPFVLSLGMFCKNVQMFTILGLVRTSPLEY